MRYYLASRVLVCAGLTVSALLAFQELGRIVCVLASTRICRLREATLARDGARAFYIFALSPSHLPASLVRAALVRHTEREVERRIGWRGALGVLLVQVGEWELARPDNREARSVVSGSVVR